MEYDAINDVQICIGLINSLIFFKEEGRKDYGMHLLSCADFKAFKDQRNPAITFPPILSEELK